MENRKSRFDRYKLPLLGASLLLLLGVIYIVPGTYFQASLIAQDGGTMPPPDGGTMPPPPDGGAMPPPPDGGGTPPPDGTQPPPPAGGSQCTSPQFFCNSLGRCANNTECQASDVQGGMQPAAGGMTQEQCTRDHGTWDAGRNFCNFAGTQPQPGTQPGMQPGTQPGMQPGTQPGMQPGTQPGMQPGTMPYPAPGGGMTSEQCTSDGGTWKSMNQGGWCEFGHTEDFFKPGQDCGQDSYWCPEERMCMGFNQPCGFYQEQTTCRPNDPWCNNQGDYEQDFSKFRIEADESRLDKFKFNESDIGRVQQDLKRDKQDLEREKKQLAQNIDRLEKKSGVSCPVITEYKSALSQIDTVLTALDAAGAKDATVEAVQQARVLLEGVHGNDREGVIGLFHKLHGYWDQEEEKSVPGLDSQLGACEDLGRFVREVERELKNVDKLCARATKKGIASTECASVKADLEKAQADPVAWSGKTMTELLAPPSDECFQGGGFPGGPMGPGGFPGGPMGPGGFPGGPMGPGGGFGGPMGPGGFPGGGEFPSGGFPGFPSGGFPGEGFPGFGGDFQFQIPGFGPFGSSFEPTDPELNESGFGGPMGGPFGDPFGGGFGFEPNPECMPGTSVLFKKLDEIRFKKIRELAMSLTKGFEQAGVCDEIAGMQEMWSGGMAPVELQKAKADIEKLFAKGNEACAAGNVDKAEKVLKKLFAVGDRYMGPGGRPGIGDQPGFGQLDIEALIAERIEALLGDVTEKIKATFEQKLTELTTAYENKLAMLEERIASMTEKLAQMNFDVDPEAERILNNVAGVPETVKEQIVDKALDPILTSATEAKAALEDAGASAAVVSKVEDIVAQVIKTVPPEKKAEVIAKELDKVTTLAKNEDDKEVVKEEVEKWAEDAEKTLATVTAEEQYTEGIVAFKDTPLDQWFGAVSHVAKEKEIIQGAQNADGTPRGEALPGKDMNGAEMACMAANGVLGEAAVEAASDAAPAGIDTGGLAWAHKCVNALEQAGVNPKDVFEDGLKGAMERKDAAELVYQLKKDELKPADIDQALEGLSDAGAVEGLRDGETEAIAGLRESAIMRGKQDGTVFEPEQTLKKIEGAQIVNELLEHLAIGE